jgi:L-threonylcarbamoyladenylate synthase
MSIISCNIDRAVQILSNEDVVAIPTETVYGLAGNIFSEKAIRKIFEVKQRPLFNPLIVHLHSYDQLNEIVTEIPPKAALLAQAFWPGSLTLVLKKNPLVPDLITAGKDTVAIRIPSHSVTLDLLKKLSFPIAAPSANPFNRISPTKAEHVANYFQNQIQMVLDGGECKNGLESTIIGFENDEPVVYRLGAIPTEDIEKIVGEVRLKNEPKDAPKAPGMLAKHYSPKTKTFITDDFEQFIQDYQNLAVGVLSFSETIKAANIKHLSILSATSDFEEAASKLYSELHFLDSLELDLIVAIRLPNIGLGKTINDRLERAAK